MAGPPPRKKRRSAAAPVPDDIAAKLAAQLTVEIGTSDLEELEQSGVIGERAKPTISLTRTDLHELDAALEVLEPSIVVADQPPTGPASGVIVDQSLTVAEMPEHQLGAAVAEREVRTQYVRKISEVRTAVEPAVRRARGTWIVVLVYLVAAAALALSIYARATS